MEVYRGFASMNEALEVMAMGTVGGQTRLPDWTEDVLVAIKRQKMTAGEGQVRVIRENTRKAPFIEYTTNPQVAVRFGTLCVIGGIVDEKRLTENVSYYPMPDDGLENGIFFKSDIPISINVFFFGTYYLNYVWPKTYDLGRYKPLATGFQVPKPLYRKQDEDILSEFVNKVASILFHNPDINKSTSLRLGKW